MSELLELNEFIEVDTPLGRGYAILYESRNDEAFWTVCLNASGALITSSKGLSVAFGTTP